MAMIKTFPRPYQELMPGYSIYHPQVAHPLEIPPIEFQSGLDVLLLEFPARYWPMMPNGLGVVHNIFSGMNIAHQTLDLNIIVYHRFHKARLEAGLKNVIGANGYHLPEDPWDIVNTADWNEEALVDCFQEHIDEVVEKIVAARPKILGASLNGLNKVFARRVIHGVKDRYPEIIVISGGHECAHHEGAEALLAEYRNDYLFIYEADLTLEPVVRSLLAGEQVKDLPGVVSRFDTPGRAWIDAPTIRTVDEMAFPHYEWFEDLGVYRTFDSKTLVPVTWSRGCRWSRCTFCAERFKWRSRDPVDCVDEIEWYRERGFDLFHCNESDLIGDPNLLMQICDEILRRGLKVRIFGQLRVHKRGTPELFQKMAQAGFIGLRFGVDGWSDRALRLQMKGSTMEMVEYNLKNALAAGIRTTANIVVGVPGETDEDIQEMVDNIAKLSPYLCAIENINTLILTVGGVYYEDPERFKIRFLGDKEELYRKYPRSVPPELWYSEEPYIDHDIRKARLARICNQLYAQGVMIGPWARYRVDEQMQEGDSNVLTSEELRTRYMELKWQNYEDRAGAEDKLRALLAGLLNFGGNLGEWYEQALPQVEKILKDHPESGLPLRMRASIMMAKGQLENALHDLNQAAHFDRQNEPEIHNELASVLLLFNCLEEAEYRFHTALSIDEANQAARFGLGLIMQYRQMQEPRPPFETFYAQQHGPHGWFGRNPLDTPVPMLRQHLLLNHNRRQAGSDQNLDLGIPAENVKFLYVLAIGETDAFRSFLSAYLSAFAADSPTTLMIHSLDKGYTEDRLLKDIQKAGYDTDNLPDLIMIDLQNQPEDLNQLIQGADVLVTLSAQDRAGLATRALALECQLICLPELVQQASLPESHVWTAANEELVPVLQKLGDRSQWKQRLREALELQVAKLDFGPGNPLMAMLWEIGGKQTAS
ncbi:MAG: radical SAM protein [Candidatus Sericytochromatia bacterium]